ncbi:uncharacterized protein LOC135831415 isoform X7 [Planococcus citri]
MEDYPLARMQPQLYYDEAGNVEQYYENTHISSLLRLALDCITKRLWSSEINSDWFENRLMNNKRVKQKLQQNLGSTFPLPSSIKKMLMKNIDVIGKQIKDELRHLNNSRLLIYIFKSYKWRDFAPSIWNFAQENCINYYIGRKVFGNINHEVDIGTLSASSDEIPFYLSMWKSFPNHLRYQIIVSLLRHDSIEYDSLKSFPRDLLFIAELLKEFDAEERKKIWLENYTGLIIAANPSHLENIMRLCFDNEEQIIEFKRQWFVNCGHADQYCLDLITESGFVALNKFASFCSSDELEAEELTKRVLHKYFGGRVPGNFDKDILLKMLRSPGRISRIIRMAEFQYLFKMSEETIKEYCYEQISRGNFERVKEFLNVSLPPEKNLLSFLRDVIKSFFDDNDLTCLKFSCSWMSLSLEKFNNLIEDLFATSEASAAGFKKEIMFSESVINFIGAIMFSIDIVSFVHSDIGMDEVECIKKFSTTFLSSEQDISKWKEDVMMYSLKGMRQRNWFLFNPRKGGWKKAFAWFLDSEEKASQFKALFSMDEILYNFIRSLEKFFMAETLYASCFDQILLWYYSNDKEEITFFKLQALRDCDIDEYTDVQILLLGRARFEFELCSDDIERFDVIRRALGYE